MEKAPLGLRLREWMAGHKKAQIAIMTIVLILLVAVVAYIVLRDSTQQQTIEAPSDLTETSAEAEDVNGPVRLLDGVLVPKKDVNPQPIAVMIENLESVRPQNGLNEASVVYETLAEGGITRFMAIYPGPPAAERIGPVRSARHYYVDWAEEYKAVYAHAGGSPQALNKLYGNTHVTDVNQIGGDQGFFWRDGDLLAPHNLFTSGALLTFALRDKELSNNKGDFEPWTFSSIEQVGVTAETISIEFSTSAYNVQWLYEPTTKTYLRSNGGAPHLDALSLEPVASATVVVQYVATELLESDTGRIDITTVGSGDAVVFRQGIAIEGTWEKDGENGRTQFLDANGKKIVLNRGTVWIEAVPNDRVIEYN